jgi:hypothetical protein
MHESGVMGHAASWVFISMSIISFLIYFATSSIVRQHVFFLIDKLQILTDKIR